MTAEEDKMFYGQHLTTYSNGTSALHVELFVQGHDQVSKLKPPPPSKPVQQQNDDVSLCGIQTVNYEKDEMSVKWSEN